MQTFIRDRVNYVTLGALNREPDPLPPQPTPSAAALEAERDSQRHGKRNVLRRCLWGLGRWQRRQKCRNAEMGRKVRRKLLGFGGGGAAGTPEAEGKVHGGGIEEKDTRQRKTRGH